MSDKSSQNKRTSFIDKVDVSKTKFAKRSSKLVERFFFFLIYINFSEFLFHQND